MISEYVRDVDCYNWLNTGGHREYFGLMPVVSFLHINLLATVFLRLRKLTVIIHFWWFHGLGSHLPGLSLQKPVFSPRPVHVAFVVENLALER
jgi:hypothetical protein